MMNWQGVIIITVAVLLVLFTNKWWLPELLNTLSGKRIKATWAGKEYALTVDEAQEVIEKQQSAFQDPDYGVFVQLMRLPNVIGVDFGPKTVRGQVADTLAFRVKVRKKLPMFELRAEEIVPASIGRIPTDVVEVSE
jgi:hypothetical protein